MTGYADGYWWSKDGLRLHYRDYPAKPAYADRPVILCLPGLTRNARDFEVLAQRLAGEWRLICPDMRGRAESAYAKDPMTYVPLTYIQDVEALLDDLSIRRFVVIGTSLGGIMAMLMAPIHKDSLAGVVLNDIGPEIEAKGLERIRGYVGTASTHPTWVHAARALAESQGEAYPDYSLEDWLDMARRLYRLNNSGRIVLDYDMKIAEPMRMPGGEAGVNMWPVLSALRDVPVLVLRGELSDLMSDATAQRMIGEIGDNAQLVTVPRVGHTPTFAEAESGQAMDAFLAHVAAQEQDVRRG